MKCAGVRDAQCRFCLCSNASGRRLQVVDVIIQLYIPSKKFYVSFLILASFYILTAIQAE